MKPSLQNLIKSFFAPLTEDDGIEIREANGDLVFGINATGTNTLDISWYLNHSDNPNISFHESTVDNGFSSYRTTREVLQGEELTVNYKDIGHVYHMHAVKQ